MSFTAVNTTEVLLARLAFMGKKAVDCGARGNCLPRTLEVATGEECERQRLIVRLLRKESILPEVTAAMIVRNRNHFYACTSCLHGEEGC